MRYLAAIVLLSFGVNGDYINDKLWADYGNIHKKTDEKYDMNHRGREGLKNWYSDAHDHGYYGEKELYLGYDQKYVTELRVIEEEVRDESNFVRPCALSDWQCIRQFFAHNSHCVPAHGPAPDPLYLARNTLLISNCNLTYTLTDCKITGFSNAKVQEFYINKHTGNVVIAFLVRNFTETSPKAYLSYRRIAKESIVLADVSIAEFDSMTFTAVIPKRKNGLRLDLADIHIAMNDPNPKYFLGPKAYNSTDPEVMASYATIVLNLNINLKEAFEYQSRLFTPLLIQKTICDFGIKLNTF